MISTIALVAVGAMLAGMGGMLAQTTGDLGVALTESAPTTVIAGASSEEEAVVAAEKAYATVEEAFATGATDADSLIAYETALSSSADYAKPLGESVTVWAGRSQTLASVVAMEVIGIGALTFAVGFIAVRMVKRAIS